MANQRLPGPRPSERTMTDTRLKAIGERRIGRYQGLVTPDYDEQFERGDVVRVDDGTAYRCRWNEANGLVRNGGQVALFESSAAADARWTAETDARATLRAAFADVGVTGQSWQSADPVSRALVNRALSDRARKVLGI